MSGGDLGGLGNLGPRESRKRMIFGWVMLAAGAALGVAFSLRDLGPSVLLLVIPFWLGSLGILQGREKT